MAWFGIVACSNNFMVNGSTKLWKWCLIIIIIFSINPWQDMHWAGLIRCLYMLQHAKLCLSTIKLEIVVANLTSILYLGRIGFPNLLVRQIFCLKLFNLNETKWFWMIYCMCKNALAYPEFIWLHLLFWCLISEKLLMTETSFSYVILVLFHLLSPKVLLLSTIFSKMFFFYFI